MSEVDEMPGSAWSCPVCGHVQTLTEPKQTSSIAHVDVGSEKLPRLAVYVSAIGCSNPECDEVQIHALLGSYGPPANGGQYGFHDIVSRHRLRPDSLAKPQPEYIPAAVRQDYQEACRIAELSPKASATLSRRCIQGMIRDFCKISKNRLIDEINALKELDEREALPRGVTPESIEAIDAVRGIGNIGAHMEKDIDLIIEVDPDEATALIELIETLLEDWYIARERRKSRFAKVNSIAESKAQKKVSAQKSNALVEIIPTSEEPE